MIMVGGTVYLPDEGTFELPDTWRRVLHPRRGGVVRPVEIDGGAGAEMRRCTEASGPFVEEVLGRQESDPRLVAEARAHLNGDVSPRGAAALGEILACTDMDRGRFADAWVSAYGLVFAAEVVAELAEVQVAYVGRTATEHLVRFRPAGAGLGWRWPWMPAAARVRALLAGAGDGDYRVAVAALAAYRRTPAQRAVVSYLVPTETAWVDECCLSPPTGENDDEADRTLLFCALGTTDQVAALGPHARAGRPQWSLDVLATLAEGVGTRIATMLSGVFDREQAGVAGVDTVKTVLGVLGQVPADEAVQMLLEHLDHRYVQPVVLETMRRQPVRALRLLALAARTSKTAKAMLAAHLRAEPGLPIADLPPEARSVVEKLGQELARVEEASPEDLPPLLVSPPWTRRRQAAQPVVLTGLEPPAESRIFWAPGTRDEWAETDTYFSSTRNGDWAAIAQKYRDGHRDRGYGEVPFFLYGPDRLTRPLIVGWEPDYLWCAELWMKPIVARYGRDALLAALKAAAHDPAKAGSLLVPFLDVRVARLMAGWLVRPKSARKAALAWLGRHGAEAVRLLVPDAVGPRGPARTGAESALRIIATSLGPDAVVDAAREYGEKAAAAAGALLAGDSFAHVRAPKIGAWADPALLPQVLLRDRVRALPPTATGHVLAMLALSKPGEMYAGLRVVTEICDPSSLAEFGWAVFQRWQMAGMPAKDGWALTGLGWIGDDETVRRLTPVIRAWPGEGGHARAVAGLDVLAAIGTDIALAHLHVIAQRIKFTGLKTRAQEKIAEIAAGLGLSPERLADRLVPDLGLDADGSLVLDYGPRRFLVGFDEQLTPYVSDEDGKRRKGLPALGVHDDAELVPAARKRFSALKKDIRAVAGDQIRRLEAAMVTQRSWSAIEFTDLFAGHPLMRHLARRLVWVADGREFRLAGDRGFADVDDDVFTPVGDAYVRLAHPLRMAGTLAAWSQIFADHGILQPFPQLGRSVYTLTGEEQASSHLTRFEGIRLPTTKLLGLERRGWTRGKPEDAGIQSGLSREADSKRYVFIDLDPGIVVGRPEEFPEQRLDAVTTGARTGLEPALRFGDLDPLIVSEILADLTELTRADR
jgi:hypothetical protein